MNPTVAGVRHLYICESVYQLFNAIILRMTVFPKEPADVLLSEHTDFSAIIPRLKKSGIFEEIIEMVCRPMQAKYLNSDADGRLAYMRNPETLIGDPLQHLYTDFFVPIDHLHPKFLYYQQLKKGVKPAIHFYEEGMRAYTIDIRKNENVWQSNVAEHYGSDSFASNVVDHYLYEPKLFSVPDPAYKLKAIPKIDIGNRALKDTLTAIFGTAPLPEERFLFFEESNFCDHNLTNDFQLFEQVAELVGRENIIVKRHPRNTIDRFSEAGYRVMEGHGIPWEMQLLHHDVSDKIFVTIVSTASITPFFLFGRPTHTIHLKHLFRGSSNLMSDAAFSRFYDKMVNHFNIGQRMIHLPQTETELREIIRYLNAYV